MLRRLNVAALACVRACVAGDLTWGDRPTYADTMNASKDVLALASLEVDLSSIAVGDSVTVKWRGKPVFIRRRTAAEIAEAETADIGTMRDPEPDANRVKDPEWLVVLGICTHLGCVPINGAGDFNGYFCPCHGSHYDCLLYTSPSPRDRG